MLKNNQPAEYPAPMRNSSSGWDEAKKRSYRYGAALSSVPGVQGAHALAEDARTSKFKYTGFTVDSLMRKLAPVDALPAEVEEHQQAGMGKAQNKTAVSEPKRVPLREEIPEASKVYDQAVKCVHRLMTYASEGQLLIGKVDQVLEGIVDSLERNHDALLLLSRVQQRGGYTYTHAVNVSILMAAFTLSMGNSRTQVTAAALAGLLHDIGKAKLPASLLHSPKALSDTEQVLVLRHPMLGCGLLSEIPNLPSEVFLAVLEHHERYDGSGYPRKLSGDAISRIGHLAAIADTYDAISSNRPHKEALHPHKTLALMFTMRKKQFHPVMLEEFVRMVGIYPVGSIVELEDGYRGIVTASSPSNPMLPVITLVLDPHGRSMPLHECDLTKDRVARIARCIPADKAGIDPCRILGITS